MLIRTIRIRVSKDDQFKAMCIVNTYAYGLIRARSYDTYSLLEFNCLFFKANMCKHDLNLAITLGINIKLED